ncbi:MAG: M42 family metallopeptidase [Opitutales bacterium]|nr:M42 family metallopeptidase [Opitutales bacterium]
MPKKQFSPPAFLTDLLAARAPSGFEMETQKVFDKYVQKAAKTYHRDALGNRIATIGEKGEPTLMLAGHIDELGLIINYIDKKGFLHFDTIGGHDRIMIPGRRVMIQTRQGTILGVTGKRAIHLMAANEREKLPKIHEMWIDIGAKDKEEAEKLVSIGDVATYDHGFSMLRGSIGVSRAFDDKAGAYVVGESLIRLAKEKKLTSKIVSVATTQEEIGTRGATISAYGVRPDLAIAVDVGHATDHPDSDHRKTGSFTLGGGPIICRGPNINPFMFERLLEIAEKEKIPHQIEADPRPTGTDARAIQMAGPGVATALLSIPLRYMHTPSEVVDLEDIEQTIRLIVGFAKSLKKTEKGIW